MLRAPASAAPVGLMEATYVTTSTWGACNFGWGLAGDGNHTITNWSSMPVTVTFPGWTQDSQSGGSSLPGSLPSSVTLQPGTTYTYAKPTQPAHYGSWHAVMSWSDSNGNKGTVRFTAGYG